MRRTDLAGGGSGRGKHAASEVASRCLPNAQAPEEHHGWNACNWQPMEDQVFIERLEPIERERGSGLIVTDMQQGGKMLLRKGRVLAVGPGKWIPGTWWNVPRSKYGIDPDGSYPSTRSDNAIERVWEWIPGYREIPAVKPGQLVIFNARWNDLTHGELRPIGSDRFSRTVPLERPLSYRFDSKIHLVQEADIAGILA